MPSELDAGEAALGGERAPAGGGDGVAAEEAALHGAASAREVRAARSHAPRQGRLAALRRHGRSRRAAASARAARGRFTRRGANTRAKRRLRAARNPKL